MAPGVAISPNAHLECARTQGSGSDNADDNTGTASGEPQLPSATATFRRKPAHPARRTAEPRENARDGAGEPGSRRTVQHRRPRTRRLTARPVSGVAR
jgi:hypothetical protein